eukprot:766545-Hanusia_phi.AAC.3
MRLDGMRFRGNDELAGGGFAMYFDILQEYYKECVCCTLDVSENFREQEMGRNISDDVRTCVVYVNCKFC